MIMKITTYIRRNSIANKSLLVYRNIRQIYRDAIRKKRSKIEKCSVRELFFQQNKKGGFNRLDIIVRLIAIECEYGLNSYGWDLYRKMQDFRCKDENISTETRINIFKTLIRSWETTGYDDSSLIEVDKCYRLIDGSHRMALSIYHDRDFVNCRVYQEEREYEYGADWFINNGFTNEEIGIINTRLEETIQNLLT